MPAHTLLGWPKCDVERLVTVVAGAVVRPTASAVEPLRLAASAASVGPPVRLGVGG